MRLPVLLAVCGAFLLAGGVALISVPVSLMVAGVEAMAAAYAIAYVKARP